MSEEYGSTNISKLQGPSLGNGLGQNSGSSMGDVHRLRIPVPAINANLNLPASVHMYWSSVSM